MEIAKLQNVGKLKLINDKVQNGGKCKTKNGEIRVST